MGSLSTLSNATGGPGISSGATVGRAEDDDPYVVEEDPLIDELHAVKPGVLRVESSKTYSIRRIMRQLMSVPIGDTLGGILSIHRSTGSKITLLEIMHPEFRAKVLSSAQIEPFPFDISPTANITNNPNNTVCRWIAGCASIHIRIGIPSFQDPNVNAIVDLWDFDRKESNTAGKTDSTLKWGAPYRLKEQILPRRADSGTIAESLSAVHVEPRIKIDDDQPLVEKVIYKEVAYFLIIQLHQQAKWERAMINFVTRHCEGMNIDQFWRYDDTNAGFYLGVVCLEKAVYVKETMEELMKRTMPGWTISYVTDRQELFESLRIHVWGAPQ